RDRARGDAAGRLACARAAAAAPVAHAVLRVVRVVRVARTVFLLHLAVVAGPHVEVGHLEADRRAERLPFEDSREDLDGVRLLALGHERALARRAPVEIGLDVGFGEWQTGRAAVDHRADAGAVRLAPRRDTKQAAPGVAHATRIPRQVRKVYAAAGPRPRSPPGACAFCYLSSQTLANA